MGASGNINIASEFRSQANLDYYNDRIQPILDGIKEESPRAYRVARSVFDEIRKECDEVDSEREIYDDGGNSETDYESEAEEFIGGLYAVQQDIYTKSYINDEKSLAHVIAAAYDYVKEDFDYLENIPEVEACGIGNPSIDQENRILKCLRALITQPTARNATGLLGAVSYAEPDMNETDPQGDLKAPDRPDTKGPSGLG